MSTALRHDVPHHMTVDEFLDWASGAPGKWQLVDGEPRAMAPASATHGIIQAYFAYVLNRHLINGGSSCAVVTEPAVVPQIRAHSNMRVPDLAVTCAIVQAGQVAVQEPVLLVEILSPSNEADTRQNVWAYASIPSVREILILHSTRIAAELLRRRPDASWPEEPHPVGPADQLTLESIGLTVLLAELYARTHLARA
ncbi:MAG TPA: Uma2 family endonuclease [Acetobacteraceae bacterium]|nr:Uma2 family endonuclease [Acetobacteraceae bacterium]